MGDDGRALNEGSHASQLHSFAMEGEDDTPENRVRFPSPLISAKANSFGGSDPDSDLGRLVSFDTSVGQAPSPSAAQETNPLNHDTGLQPTTTIASEDASSS